MQIFYIFVNISEEIWVKFSHCVWVLVPNDWDYLHSYQQCMRILLCLHPHQYLLIFVFFVTAVCTMMRWFCGFWSVLLWWSVSEASIFFICLLAICFIILKEISVQITWLLLHLSFFSVWILFTVCWSDFQTKIC